MSINEEQLKNIYGPVGLEIGAETAEEIAISIIAEIKAVLSGKSGGLLREKHDAIHSMNDTFVDSKKFALSSMQYTISKCAVVILAAGQSSRLGSPKQLLQFNGKSLLQHSVEEALQTHLPVIVVVGAKSRLIKDELKEFNVSIAENNRWHEGMSTSMQCGLAAAKNLKDEIDGIIFMVSDQPFVSITLLSNLLKAQNENGLPIAASGYAGRLGTPVLFHKFFFDESDEFAR